MSNINNQFIGRYESILNHDTITIPKKISEKIKKNLYITKFYDNALAFFDEELIIHLEQVEKIPLEKQLIEVKNNKIKIPLNYIEHASLEKNCLFTGCRNYFELWDLEKYKYYEKKINFEQEFLKLDSDEENRKSKNR